MTAPDRPLDEFSARVRTQVDTHLLEYFGRKRREVVQLSPHSMELVEELETLTMRGGKRLRPIVAAAAMRAVAPELPLSTASALGASLELLQTYLLAHDDIMDADLERRAGPSLHAAFRARHRDTHVGDCLGILGGDLASTLSLELFLEVPFAHGSFRRAMSTYVQLCKEVYLGQHLDVVRDDDLERTHDLKTGSYTVRGPVQLGALLGRADEHQLQDLTRWANPLGRAFQIIDDVMGTFGASRETGKPGDDLVHGKRNSLVLMAEQSFSAEDLAIVLRPSQPGASESDLLAACDLLEKAGMRDQLERRAESLLAESDVVLRSGRFAPESVELLQNLARALVRRTR